MGTKHDETSRRLARKEGVDYNKGPGPDVVSNARAIEVETKGTVRDGLRQLQGFKKAVYIAGADDAATNAALEVTKGTTVGVMDQNGRIVRNSTRKR